MYKSLTSHHLYRIRLFSICETAGIESCWIKFVAKFVSPEYFFGRNINFNGKFFSQGFLHIFKANCASQEILKINSCLLSRLFHTGKIQTETKTTE